MALCTGNIWVSELALLLLCNKPPTAICMTLSSDDINMQELVPAVAGDVMVCNQPSACLPLASGVASTKLLYVVWYWETCKN